MRQVSTRQERVKDQLVNSYDLCKINERFEVKNVITTKGIRGALLIMTLSNSRIAYPMYILHI